jgi:hypothetical protein
VVTTGKLPSHLAAAAWTSVLAVTAHRQASGLLDTVRVTGDHQATAVAAANLAEPLNLNIACAPVTYSPG